LLIDEGADINVKNNNGESALNIAIKNHHPEITDLLRKAGAKE
jgi:ankyrin repeat protein